ncbi:MAG: hypothetical protein F6K56_00780 [Moorea sp. SIO3G5]|nr:hypothetical protein [Moorena sp. SIO3G5]
MTWDEKFYEQQLIKGWDAAHELKTTPSWIQQLVWAADQFIVNRPLVDAPDDKTIMAVYPWFGDWGRDTIISLPGLTVSTGRPEVARTIKGVGSRDKKFECTS